MSRRILIPAQQPFLPHLLAGRLAPADRWPGPQDQPRRPGPSCRSQRLSHTFKTTTSLPGARSLACRRRGYGPRAGVLQQCEHGGGT
jgi:hypothetical protein